MLTIITTIMTTIITWFWTASGLKSDLDSLVRVVLAGWSSGTTLLRLLWQHLLRPALLLLFTLSLLLQLALILWILRALHRAAHSSGFYWRCWHKYQDVAWTIRRAMPPPPVMGVIYLVLFFLCKGCEKYMAEVHVEDEWTIVRVETAVAVSQTEAVRLPYLPAVAVSQTEAVGLQRSVVDGWERVANQSGSISRTSLECDEWQRGLVVWCERCQQVHLC